MTKIKRFAAMILVLVTALTVLVIPAAAANIVCYKCGSDNLSFRDREYTYCGRDDYGRDIWYVEELYACGDCTNLAWYYVGMTTQNPNG